MEERKMSLAEKYRPKTEAELIGNEKAVDKLRQALREGEHCFLYGPPGIGEPPRRSCRDGH